MDVVLDTSVLLLPFTDGLRLTDELERVLGAVTPIVPASVHEELHHFADGNDARARAARGALQLSRRWHVEATELPGDDGVLDVVRRRGAALCSNDRRLCDEAAKHGVPVVAPRGKGRLERR